jgi:Fic family protein
MQFGVTKMRTYLNTHPWITFEMDWHKLSGRFWLRLGEAQANCLRIAEVPLQPDVAKQLLAVVTSKGVMATAAIEGNTLSEEEVLEAMEGKLILPASRDYQKLEIDNVLRAFNTVKDELLEGGDVNIDIKDIKSFNRMFLEGLELEDNVIPGKIRTYPAGVPNYRGAPPEDCEYLLQQLCNWLNEPEFLTKGDSIAHGILRAILAHLYIAWIHPFGDGNGRTARLVELKMMLAAGVPLIASHLLTNHYNQTRTEYYRQLGDTSKSGGDVIPFFCYSVDGLLEGLNSQFDDIQEQELRIAWRNYVYDQFKDRKGLAADRRRKLVLDLSDHNEPVQFSEIRKISPRIAELYASRTSMTIRRDITILRQMELIGRAEDGYFVRREKMRSLLPSRRQSS